MEACAARHGYRQARHKIRRGLLDEWRHLLLVKLRGALLRRRGQHAAVGAAAGQLAALHAARAAALCRLRSAEHAQVSA